MPDSIPQNTTAQPPHGLLAGLNPEQLAAVTLPARPALILAGAGSGKTRVLTTRIAWLLQTGQAAPGGMMAVTFTNKAAKEMGARLSAMLPVNVRSMWIGTFHGLCNRFLRLHWKLAGLPQTFQILDSGDQQSAVKRIIKGMNLDEERFVPKQISHFIAASKEDGKRPKDVEVRDPQSRTWQQIYQSYEDQCQREGVVDFAELMLRSFELLRDNEPLRTHYQERFRHILVDEFQDTNRLQYAWLKMLAGTPAEAAQGRGNAIFAVGDDDQSIYAFRGARVGNMADFEREYRIDHIVKLERNYRSFGNILDSANALISHNSRRLGKNLRTEAGPGEPVRVMESPSDFAEAQWLLEEIRALHRSGTHLHEIALLYRSNAQSRVIESALFNAGVPYRVWGGLRFFERAEVKHALAYLRLIENPNDDTSFLRVVNFPARGIGARSVEQLQDLARQSGQSLHQSVNALSGAAGTKMAAFNQLIATLQQATQGQTLRQIIEKMLDLSGLLSFYRLDKDGTDRLENLDELLNAAEAFVTIEGFGKEAVGRTSSPEMQPDTGEILSPLGSFLTHAALEAGDNQAQAGQDAVQLMTVHAAKGLEFDAVFITGLEEGLFPHDNAVNSFTSAGPEGLEEERRLMYVAITRARKRLYLSASQTRMLHGQTRYNALSRFLDELPPEALKWLSGKHRHEAPSAPSWANSGFTPPAFVRTKPTPFVPTQISSTANTGLRRGQHVFHTKFGEGTVLTLEGQGDDARAQVNFNRHGTKWLALSIAKLTPID
ncbi:UvrD-helicase domain-containing protein [Leptothrix ochracea]|uniref:UvrD-helicase domain-containing protein n=1 Tax=Leptothrix ochracea TaxID=735331 RepID=UPI0034E2EC26